MANYEFFYDGTPYSLEPSYGNFIGYNSSLKNFSLTTDPRTANQLKEVSDKLSTGLKQIEVEAISPEILESIPKQHLEEINRLSKITGITTSVHGPLVEPSGFTKQGWSEEDKFSAERQMKMALERSHEINPEGNVPLTFHSSAVLPGSTSAMIEEGGKRREEETEIMAINQETKQIIPIHREIKYYPEEGEVLRKPREDLKTINNTEWINSITNLAFYKKEADEILKRAHANIAPIIAMRAKGEEISVDDLSDKQKQAIQELGRAELFLDNVSSSFRALYNKAYKYSDKDVKEVLSKEIAKPWVEWVEEKKRMIKTKERMDEIDIADDIIKRSKLIDNTLDKLKILENKPPQVYKPVEEFAQEHSAQTFANVALHGYKKYGDKAPIVSIENPPVGGALSRAEEIKKLIENSRERFVEKAISEGYSKSQAKDAAEKLIGATWDVGHINMLRKQGFESRDIVAETEKIAPFVKHVHLSDNFGFEHTELPMGMGNVPMKEIMEKLGKEGFEGKKVIEATSWWQHFKTPPVIPTLEAFGSPLYSMQMQPTWNQAAYSFGDYFSGYGTTLPEQHFSMYGAGFSGMPVELGGQMPGKQSRFAGTPNE